jgi:hypothetical protein
MKKGDKVLIIKDDYRGQFLPFSTGDLLTLYQINDKTVRFKEYVESFDKDRILPATKTAARFYGKIL